MLLVRSEPLSLSRVEQTVEYHNSLGLLWDSGFLQFLQNFNGHNSEVALQLARSFKNGRVKIWPLKFEVTEEFIVASTRLENIDEQWFKNQKLERKQWKHFFFNKKMKVDWKEGVSRSALLGQWQDLLFIL